MTPRVVHIIDRLPPDGAERLLCEILRYRSSEFEYEVLCLVEGGEFEQNILELGVPVTILGKKPGIDIGMLWRLWKWLRHKKPQVVHTHLFTADTWGRLAARLAFVPQVFSTVHSVNSWQKWPHKVVDRMLAMVTTSLVACTSLVAEKLVKQDGISSKRVVTLPNGVDLERFRNISPVNVCSEFSLSASMPVMAVLGRLEPVKGQAYLLSCLAELRDQGVSAQCLFIGDGPDLDVLRQQVSELQLEEIVRFAGFRRDVPQMLSAIDVLVIPSQWEGLPMALLEAMALGKAVVAHRVGGIPDVIRDKKEGLLVEQGNKDEMVAALRRVMSSDVLRREYGNAALTRVQQHYSAEALSHAYEDLYKQTKSGRRRPRSVKE